MLTLKEIKSHPQVLEFINQTERVLSLLNYTDHGIRHSNIVAERAVKIAKKIGLSKKNQELSAIAGFCHDMANFISRTYHNYFASILFHQIFQNDFKPEDLSIIMRALANHDKKIEEVAFGDPVSAIIVLADKSDVDRSRVIVKKIKDIKSDIHDRVNYAVKTNNLSIDKNKKIIALSLEIDDDFVPAMEYFEIFTERMVYCRQAAKYLGYNFSLVINNFKLL